MKKRDLSREERRQRISRMQDWEMISAEDAAILNRMRIDRFRRLSEMVGLPKFSESGVTYYRVGDAKDLSLKLTHRTDEKFLTK